MRNLERLLKSLFLNEAHLGKFNMDVFKNLMTLGEKQEYAKKHLTELGRGSSRVVYAISTSKVLKIAKTDGPGRAQNMTEISVWTDPKTKTVAARIFDFDEEYMMWLVMEIAQPFEHNKFNELLGIPVELTMYDVLKLMLKQDTYASIMRSHRVARLDMDDKKRVMLGLANLAINPPPFLKALRNLVKTNRLALADITAEHFGKTADGRIVLFDYGYDKDTAETWYGHSLRSYEKTK